MTPSKSNHLLDVLSLNTLYLEVMTSTYAFDGNTHILSIAEMAFMSSQAPNVPMTEQEAKSVSQNS